MRRRTSTWLLGTTLVVAGPLFVPEALAFPFHATVGGASVWSEAPIPPAIGGVLARADALVRTSPIAHVPGAPSTGRRIFLTQGGWRWRWLAFGASGAFGLTRPLCEAVIVNRSDVTADRVENGAGVGGLRTLSGVIAHERVHGLVRARYGLVAERMMPIWVREGYPDYVARESTLSDREAAALHRAGAAPPALAYYDGRRRVATALAANGGSVDTLFADLRR